MTLIDTSVWIEVFRARRPLDLEASVAFDDAGPLRLRCPTDVCRCAQVDPQPGVALRTQDRAVSGADLPGLEVE